MTFIRWDFGSDKLHLSLDRSIIDMVQDDLYSTIRQEIKKTCETDEIRQMICDEISKTLQSAEGRASVGIIIAEVVSETIKTTILQLKEQNIL